MLYKESNLELPDGSRISKVKDFCGVETIQLYDPGVEEFSTRPSTNFDGVISTDVLEHIPEEDIDWVLAERFSFAKKSLYMNIASIRLKLCL